MAHFLTDPAEISEAQESLLAAFCRGVEPIRSAIGYQSGGTKRDVYWHQQLGFWGSLNAKPPNEKRAGRFWNAFGTEDPNASSTSLSIVCEVNPAHGGDTRKVSGFLGRDKAGQTILLHKGKLNSNKPGPGLTMEFFRQNYKGKELIIDGHFHAVVCVIGSSRMMTDMAKFVFEAQRIKKLHNDRSGSR